MRINLTEPQMRALQPFKDRVQAAYAMGSPGMLVAQVCWDNGDQKWWLEPGFLPHELAKQISGKAEP